MNTKRQETENVVILDCENLTSSTVTRNNVFGAIHKQLLDKLAKQICESVEREKLRRDKWSFEQNMGGLKGNDNFPLNYFITGKRGSGKTTFLRQVVKKIESEDSRDVKIKFLHWYDPSESFGVPADFFIEVTAAIKTKVEEFSENTNRHSSKYDDTLMLQSVMLKLDKAIVRFSQEREALSGLSEHRAANLRINDPEMNKEIQKNFKECMRLLCGLYDVDAFVLIIDDIDIRTEQCYNVLENLRLFISNEYLAVLMAGDRTINIERVRERFFKEYDYQYHQSDEQGKEERLSYVVTHAAQYFAKLFPVKQQFELRSLYTLSHKRNPVVIKLKYEVKNTKKSVTESLEELLGRIFEAAIGTKDFKTVSSHVDVDADEISEEVSMLIDPEVISNVNTFMSLPLRNILQILDYCFREGILNEIVRSGSENPGEAKQGREQTEFIIRTALNRSLRDQLPDLFYNYEKLDSDDGRAYYALLLRLCQDTGDLEHGFHLSDEIERGSRYRYLTLVLAANFKRYVKDFNGFLSYLCYGPASVALYAKALEQFRNTEGTSDSVLKTQNDLRKSFEEYLHIGNWRSASRWARHANMIWCYDYKKNYVHSGVVRIQNAKTIKKLGEYLMQDNPDKTHFKNAIALIVSMNKSDGRDNSYYISVYSFLAFILECVERCDSAFNTAGNNSLGENAKQRKKLARMMLRSLIRQYLPISTCKHPEWQIPVHQEGSEQNETILITENDILTKERKKLNSLTEEIIDWYIKTRDERGNRWEKVDNISPQTMGAFWSDFYDFLRTVSHEYSYLFISKNPPSATGKNNSFAPYRRLLRIVVTIFRRYTLSSLRGKVDATKYYMACIGSFPLVKHLSGIFRSRNAT